MKIDNQQIFTMPLVMGPLFPQAARPEYVYSQVVSLILQFTTDREAVVPLVPDCFQVGPEPLVTVSFGEYHGVDFLAGGGYRTATIGVSAGFQGAEDQTVGQYILVMFEDKTLPIIGGREQLGIPKLFADISSARIQPDQAYRCQASLWGHLLFGVEVAPLKKQNAVVRAAATREFNKYPWLGYKYIPSFAGPPDASYPTEVWNKVKLDGLWFGDSGQVTFGSAGEEDLSFVSHLVSALKALPVAAVSRTILMQGSSCLQLNKSRRLH